MADGSSSNPFQPRTFGGGKVRPRLRVVAVAASSLHPAAMASTRRRLTPLHYCLYTRHGHRWACFAAPPAATASFTCRRRARWGRSWCGETSDWCTGAPPGVGSCRGEEGRRRRPCAAPGSVAPGSVGTSSGPHAPLRCPRCPAPVAQRRQCGSHGSCGRDGGARPGRAPRDRGDPGAAGAVRDQRHHWCAEGCPRPLLFPQQGRAACPPACPLAPSPHQPAATSHQLHGPGPDLPATPPPPPSHAPTKDCVPCPQWARSGWCSRCTSARP